VRGGAVDGCVGGEHGADYSAAWGTNHDANKGGNPARRPTQETGTRAGGEAANQREVTAWNVWIERVPSCKVVLFAPASAQIGRTYVVGEKHTHLIDGIDLSAGLVDFVTPDSYDKLAAEAAHDTLPCKAQWIDPQWKVVSETPVQKDSQKTLTTVCKEWEQKHPLGSPLDRVFGNKSDDSTNIPEGAILGSPEGCQGPLETDYNQRLKRVGKSTFTVTNSIAIFMDNTGALCRMGDCSERLAGRAQLTPDIFMACKHIEEIPICTKKPKPNW
jgi:hypothetical protein